MLLAGPFTGRLLGDMGAEVIKVEPPGQPDPMREWGKSRYKGRSLWWPVQSRNKKCVTLNLRTERGQQLLLDLVKHADALTENFRPGTLERWNVAPEQLWEANPKLVIARISGLRPDRPVRAARRLRLRVRGDGRHPLHQRLPGRAAAANAHLPRRLAGRHVRGAGHPRRALQARRARFREGAGDRRLPARVELLAAGEHRARVRPARHRPRPRRHRAEGRGAVEHLQVARRQVDRHRRERRQRLPAAVRGDGAARARRRCALLDASRPRRQPGGDRGHRRRLGRRPRRVRDRPGAERGRCDLRPDLHDRGHLRGRALPRPRHAARARRPGVRASTSAPGSCPSSPRRRRSCAGRLPGRRGVTMPTCTAACSASPATTSRRCASKA